MDRDRAERGGLIVHIVRLTEWDHAQRDGAYHAESLATEGFIHCSLPRQILGVARSFFAGESGLLLVCVQSQKVRAPIRYEGPDGDDEFPHIYGPLNLDAVSSVLPFERGSDGEFVLPPGLAELDRKSTRG